MPELIDKRIMFHLVGVSSTGFTFPFQAVGNHNNLIKVISNTWRGFGVHFFTWISGLYALFAAIRIMSGFSSSEQAKVVSLPLMMHILALAQHSIMFIFGLVSITYTYEFAACFNQLIIVNTSDDGKTTDGDKQKGQWIRRRERIVEAFNTLLTTTTIGMAFFYVLKPNNANYIYSILPYQNLFSFVLGIHFEWFLVYRLRNYSHIVVLSSFAFVITVRLRFRELIERVQDSFSSTIELVQSYRALYLLTQLWNSSFGVTFVPLSKNMAELLAPVSMFTTIRLFGQFESDMFMLVVPLLSLNGFIFAAAEGKVLSSINQMSVEFLDSLKKRAEPGDRKLNKMYYSSCQVLVCQVGSILTADTSLEISSIRFQVDLLMLLLLNF